MGRRARISNREVRRAGQAELDRREAIMVRLRMVLAEGGWPDIKVRLLGGKVDFVHPLFPADTHDRSEATRAALAAVWTAIEVACQGRTIKGDRLLACFPCYGNGFRSACQRGECMHSHLPRRPPPELLRRPESYPLPDEFLRDVS